MENEKLLKLIYKKLCEISDQLYSFESNFLDYDELIRAYFDECTDFTFESLDILEKYK